MTVFNILCLRLTVRFGKTLCLPALLLAAMGLASAEVSAAAEDDNKRLYNVGVDVASRSVSDRRAGAAAGLEVMLTRLSGLTSLPQSSALSAARRKPERYYAQYRYYSTNRYDELGQPLTQLNLQFSPRAMRSLMLDAKLPLWTLNRPRLALWLAERSGESIDVIEDPEHPLLAAAIGRADYRGLPSVMPGLVGLGSRSVWNRDKTALGSAAEGAGAKLVLVGRAEQLGPDEWQVRWSSWGGGVSRSNSKNLTLSGSLESVTAPAIDMIANALVNQFTVAGGEAGTLELVVDNIAAVSEYAALLTYLSSRSYIDDVSVAGIRGDELSLRITTTGSAEKLMQLLAIDSRLVESTRPRKLAPSPRSAQPSLPSLPGESPPEYGSRTAISVPAIADAQLRVSWQG